jgi:hypothetical protein
VALKHKQLRLDRREIIVRDSEPLWSSWHGRVETTKDPEESNPRTPTSLTCPAVAEGPSRHGAAPYSRAHLADRLSWILPIVYQTAVVPVIRRVAVVSPRGLRRVGGRVLRRLGLR